ncbi:MAG: 2-oxoacid:acceptor oxidoreductase family protein [Planctomycetaceae bacterium]|nr:2-oxoacid:acceptor oxidoreductase family protein [Planctomycetaceae bacterium]
MDAQSRKMIIAGFGGQGIVLVGNVIARACVIQKKNVVGMVAYGAEMRGGTAYATVVVSDEEIGSPFVDCPDAAIILNQPSLEKFEADLRPNGLIVLNTSMTQRPPRRADLNRIEVDATQIAHELGNLRVANIVALGAFIAKSNLLRMSSIEQGLSELFSSKNPKLIDLNIQALHAGAERSRFCPLKTEQA